MTDFFRTIFISQKKTLFYVTLLLILLVGVFFRTYHFYDWLHFETDQVDDYLAVSPAVEAGVGELPLVGPKAGATSLRLGPIFYIFEYIGASLTGNTPAGHASVTLFFALLSLPLFFFTASLFFEKIITLCLTGIFSTSIFMILYSRFSWNPNLLPFFVLLSIFSLIKAVSTQEPRKQLIWMSSFAIALAVIMQLHIASLVITPVCAVIFLLWKRPSFPKHVWLAGALFFILLFSPMIVHEIAVQGQTFRELTGNASVHSKNSRDGITSEFIQTIRYHSGEYLLILTGYDIVNGSYRPNGSSFGISCPSCKSEAPFRIAGYLFLIISIILLLKLIFRETDKQKKDFLILTLLWFTVSFLFFFYVLISGKYLYPRFFLLVSPLSFFFFGFFLHWINPQKNKLRLYSTLAITLFIICINTRAITKTFKQNARVLSSKDIVVETEDIFPHTQRITLEQQQRIVDFITARVKVSDVPLYLKSESEYEPSLWTLLRKNGIDFQGGTSSSSPLYEQGMYVFIYRTASPLTKDMTLYKTNFSVNEEVSFGALTLQILKPKPEFIIGTQQTDKQSYPSVQSALKLPRFKSVLTR